MLSHRGKLNRVYEFKACRFLGSLAILTSWQPSEKLQCLYVCENLSNNFREMVVLKKYDL